MAIYCEMCWNAKMRCLTLQLPVSVYESVIDIINGEVFNVPSTNTVHSVQVTHDSGGVRWLSG